MGAERALKPSWERNSTVSSENAAPAVPALGALLGGIGTAIARIEHDLLAGGRADIGPLNRLVDELHARRNGGGPDALNAGERLALAEAVLEVERLIVRLRQAAQKVRSETETARRAGEAALAYARLQTG